MPVSSYFPPLPTLGYATLNALPGVPLIRTLGALVKNIPCRFCHEFPVTEESYEKISEMFASRNVIMGGIQKSRATPMKRQYKREVSNRLHKRLRKVKEIGQNFKLRSISYSVSFPKAILIHLFPLYHRRYFPPSIIYTPRQVSIINKKGNKWQNTDRDTHFFLIARQVAHIAKCHAFARATLHIGINAIHLTTWYYGMHTSLPLKQRFAATFATSLAVQIPTTLFYLWANRRLEKAADIAAMDALDSNDGAHSFLDNYGDQMPLDHPPLGERRKYITEWKSKKS